MLNPLQFVHNGIMDGGIFHMKLKELAGLLAHAKLEGSGDARIAGLQIDSRKVRAGDAFICISGYKQDGHDYAESAAASGAAALVVERKLPVALPQLIVRDCRHALAVLACHFYGYPSGQLKMIGVTGTNGKSTTTYLIDRILNDADRPAGLIGTIQTAFGGRSIQSNRTTPDALELQSHLRTMLDEGAEYCVMEVSSHALEQGRVKGCDFRTAVFTNLTQDHLDYHGTMERYQAAKGLFFTRMGNVFDPDPAKRKYVVLNADDPASKEYAAYTAAETITYGIDRPADIRATDIQATSRGTRFRAVVFQQEAMLETRLIGKFNVYNALAAIAATVLEGVPLDAIRHSLESISGVEGRVEPVEAGQEYPVIVDYAHTPDGLENVLQTVKPLASGRLICVFGCGGDRDREKRPLMGKIAARYADIIIMTSDNPRTEDPESILDEIEQGLIEEGATNARYERIADRAQAIQKAVEMASRNDVVLIAGKGHETYQTIGQTSCHFDDRLIAKEAIRGLHK